jgi:hypothetical protein
VKERTKIFLAVLIALVVVAAAGVGVYFLNAGRVTVADPPPARSSAPATPTAPSMSPPAALSPTPTATSGPSLAASPTSDPVAEAAAVEAAKAAVTAYYAVFYELLQDPAGFDATRFDTVAADDALAKLQAFRNQYLQAGWTVSGDAVVVSATVVSVDMTADPVTGAVPTVRLNVCKDISGVDVVDSTGKSLVPADRQNRSLVGVTVANATYPDGPWLVVEEKDRQVGVTC